MEKNPPAYCALLSSDWSECLSPSGPFDFIEFHFPQLRPLLREIFRSYTGNRISLGEACRQIQGSLPATVTAEMMDAYLERSFAAYCGVPELIEWCLSHGVLFMINTTAMVGYFQRVFAKGLLPRVPVLSANGLIRFPAGAMDPGEILELSETSHKARNTRAVLRKFAIPAEKVVVMGDSGGDGPHFEWAQQAGAFTVGSMTKPSLAAYCEEKAVTIGQHFGLVYGSHEARSVDREMTVDFRALADTIQNVLEK